MSISSLLAEDIPEGVRIQVKVSPGASRSRIMGVLNGALKLSVCCPPEKGKANQAVIELLSEVLGMGRRQIEIQQGLASQYKRVLIGGIDAVRLRSLLRNHLQSPQSD